MRNIWFILCRFLLLLACGGLAVAGLLLVCRFPLLAVVLGVLAYWRRRRWQGGGYAHGTARWADFADLQAAGLDADEGLLLGRAGSGVPPPSRWQGLRGLLRAPWACSEEACRLFLAAVLRRSGNSDGWIRICKFVHLLTVAAPGRGKNVAVVTPNLLTWFGGSLVLTDPKGESYRLCAHVRRARGRKIVLLHPFLALDPYRDNYARQDLATLNPLDLIPTGPYTIDLARELATAIVLREDTRDPHWNARAIDLIAFAIVFVCYFIRPPERNLQTVREIVADATMYQNALKLARASGGMVARFASQLQSLIDKELASVQSTAHRHMAWLDSEAVAASTCASSFNPMELLSGNLDVFLVLPAHLLRSHAGVMRIWIHSLLKAVTLGGPQEERLTLFLLDECGHLGFQESVVDAITLLRGYGTRLWFIFQSCEQICEIFKEKAGIFLDAIDTQMYFGLNGYDTADLVSKRLGPATIEVESYQENTSRSYTVGTFGQSQDIHHPEQRSAGRSWSVSEQRRDLLQPSEILQLPSDRAVIFTKDAPPILSELVPYWDPAFRRLAAGAVSSPLRRGLAAAVFALLSLAASALVLVSLTPGPTPPRPGWGPGSIAPGPYNQTPYAPTVGPGSPAPIVFPQETVPQRPPTQPPQPPDIRLPP